jgi:integrase/recombinase XerD
MGWIGAPGVSGPLAEHASGFEQWLASGGYSAQGAWHRLWQLDHLSRWLEREQLRPDQLTAARLEQFLAARRAAGYLTWLSPRSLRVPLAFLREVGAVPALVPITADGPIDVLLCDYRRYLVFERGLAPKTVEIFERVGRMFLAEHDQPGAVRRLTAADVTAFLARECPSRSIGSAQQVVTALRSLLRYLHVTGEIELPLRWAVPGVADRRGLSLPRGLEPAAVVKLLASCDRRTLVGRRNYAVLLLMARLGLRAGEVAAMQLDDLDWRAGELLVHGNV